MIRIHDGVGCVRCLLVVLPRASLSVPDLKTVAVKPNRSPVVATDQPHRLSCRDRGTASIAGLPEAGTVPQLNRALAREATFVDPMSNELSDDIRNHTSLSITSRYRSPISILATENTDEGPT
jgi:hypothetical protein